ncbi:phiSA1p31-related protein [Streptomyces sp. NPDC020141]|uniref:phiSA1p31-related protein n=1 Tax=Streptomyces sp. NPDC020141 TaxID=3365065 RepID=UPI0037947DCE
MSVFEVGDDVISVAGDRYIIEGGPFSGYVPWYAARAEDGVVHLIGQSALRPVEISVGDRVTWDGREYTVEAGPFQSSADSAPWYVVGWSGGHNTLTGHQLRRASAYSAASSSVETAETFEFRGVEYEIGARYCDSDGDVFVFKSELSGPHTRDGNNDRTPLGSEFRYLTEDCDEQWIWSLGEVVRMYGPLTKV